VRISACVIAKDEADRIGPCLESVRWCDEVLVLDSGSTDGTQDLVRRAGARLVETDWPGWIAQKNRAVDAASNDWILSVDADERVDPELRAALEELRARLPEAPEGPDAPVAYEVTRKVHFLGRWVRHGGLYPEWRIRLFHRAHARWGGMDPHDHVEATGRVERVRRGNLEHYTYRDVSDHVRRMDRFSSAAARELFARGRRSSLLALLFRPPWHFLSSYVLRLGFLDGRAGLSLAVMRANYVFWKYLKLWEIGRAAAGKRT
jgi:glycosyltransferase involved in cell wall biosynthesis